MACDTQILTLNAERRRPVTERYQRRRVYIVPADGWFVVLSQL